MHGPARKMHSKTAAPKAVLFLQCDARMSLARGSSRIAWTRAPQKLTPQNPLVFNHIWHTQQKNVNVLPLEPLPIWIAERQKGSVASNTHVGDLNLNALASPE